MDSQYLEHQQRARESAMRYELLAKDGKVEGDAQRESPQQTAA